MKQAMIAKRLAAGLVSTAVVALIGAAGLPGMAAAEEWRAGGATSPSWNPGPHPRPVVSPSNPVVTPPGPVARPYRIPGPARYYGGGAAAAAGAAAGVAAGSVMTNALSNPQPQPYSPPSSVYIAPPKAPAADPAAPQPSYPIRAGATPPPPGYPDRNAYCASMYPSYDPMTQSYVDDTGQRQYCQ